MTRYTIDHGGERIVPKALWPEAQELLARYEDTQLSPLDIVRLEEAYNEERQKNADLKAKHDRQVGKLKVYLNWLAGRMDVDDPAYDVRKKVKEIFG